MSGPPVPTSDCQARLQVTRVCPRLIRGPRTYTWVTLPVSATPDAATLSLWDAAARRPANPNPNPNSKFWTC